MRGHDQEQNAGRVPNPAGVLRYIPITSSYQAFEISPRW